MNHYDKPELLAPCGSPEALDAAICGGADAVYFGGKLFNARMNAKNFDDKALADAIGKCHKSGVKAYITLNTQIYDKELEDALRYSAFLYESGADALILADLGLGSLIKEYIPKFELHASTQACGHSTDCAEKFAALGFSRMVCARELSGEDIKTLCRNSPIEIEAFIHGAMCVCHSGQCLMSSVIGNRSGNRGECAQPCRMKYNGSYPLSLKDMSLCSHIEELLKTGVASLKIEGRMKSPEYVYGVVSVYRRLIDEGRNADEREKQKLAELFSRGGFTDGYFTGNISRSMLGIRSEDDKEATKKSRVDFKDIRPKREALHPSPEPTVLPPHEFFKTKPERSQKKLALCFENPSQIPDNCAADEIYLPLHRFDGGKANGIIIPPVIKDCEKSEVLEKIKDAVSKGASHALVGNAGHIEMLMSFPLVLHGSLRLNVFNSKTLMRYGMLKDITVCAELSLPQIRDLPFKKRVLVYGRLPLMLLEKSCEEKTLKDRTGAEFPVLKEEKREIVYNSVPVYMADRRVLLEENGIRNVCMLFTTESKKECEDILKAYEKGLEPKSRNIKRIKK